MTEERGICNTPSDFDRMFKDIWLGRGGAKPAPYLKELVGWLKEGKRNILDVGCGLGRFLSLCKENGHKVSGIDWSEVSKHYQWTEHQINVLLEEFPPLPFPDKSFSTVTAFQVLEHIDYPGLLMTELLRVAAHEVIVTVPWRDKEPEWHTWYWNMREFKKFLRLFVPDEMMTHWKISKRHQIAWIRK